MKGLIAKRPILYRGRMYRAGDRLPGDDTKMTAAWLENHSAELRGADRSPAPGQALEDLKKDDLERMAADLGMDVSKARTKADLIALIAAAQAPAEGETP